MEAITDTEKYSQWGSKLETMTDSEKIRQLRKIANSGFEPEIAFVLMCLILGGQKAVTAYLKLMTAMQEPSPS